MKRTLLVALIPWLSVVACTTPPSDAPANDAGSDTAATPAPPAEPAFREFVIPEGTSLRLALTGAVASDTSRVQDPVTATLTRAITLDGVEVVPEGAQLAGVVTDAEPSGRVRGRASIAFRFSSMHVGDRDYDLESAAVSRLAPATKSEDASKIGIGAGAGAVIGGLLGGKGGAAKGAAIGGGAGTGVVLATKGEEVRLGPGAAVTTTLTAPVTIRVPMP